MYRVTVYAMLYLCYSVLWTFRNTYKHRRKDVAIKYCKWCGLEITLENQAAQNTKWGTYILNTCKPCKSKMNAIYKKKAFAEKSVPCSYCGGLCIKKCAKAFCSIKCTLLGSIDKVDDCWIWKGWRRQGYGKISIKGKEAMVHRVSYELFKGSIDKGKILLHNCHNPSCINPDHLRQGTVQDNSNDMVKAGRSLVGSKHPNAKLTETKVNDIIKSYMNENVGINDLARKYEVGPKCIEDIFRGRTWNHDF